MQMQMIRIFKRVMQQIYHVSYFYSIKSLMFISVACFYCSIWIQR